MLARSHYMCSSHLPSIEEAGDATSPSSLGCSLPLPCHAALLPAREACRWSLPGNRGDILGPEHAVAGNVRSLENATSLSAWDPPR